MTMVQSLNLALDQSMASDPDVLCMGEDIGVNGGVFRVTKGLLEKYGPDRVRDTPLAECGIIGTGVGMAIYGLKPVAEIQFSGFTMQAFDQIEQNMARYRNRTRGRTRADGYAAHGGGNRARASRSANRIGLTRRIKV
jgi:pyruvate dehydrogenase E1 component beta subunit